MTDQPSRPVRSVPEAASLADPSLVGLVADGILDAEVAALVWFLVEGGVPLVVAVPPDRLTAGAQLLRGALRSVVPDDAAATAAAAPLDRSGAWQLVHGGRAGAVVAAASLAEARDVLAGPPYLLSRHELTFLGCVLVLGPREMPPAGAPSAAGPPVRGRSGGRLLVTAAHYVRPLARDAHGHAQELPPAVLATWDDRLGRYEHFAWGVVPEIAARLGRPAGDLEADLHHRRDDLAGLATAGVTSLDQVRTLIAGYRAGYGAAHGSNGGASRPH